MWLTFKVKYTWKIKISIEDEDDSLNISKIVLISNKLRWNNIKVTLVSDIF